MRVCMVLVGLSSEEVLFVWVELGLREECGYHVRVSVVRLQITDYKFFKFNAYEKKFT